MGHRHTVLVVHTDQEVRDALESLLKTYGLDVVAAATAQEVVRAVRHTPPPCAILLLEMPLIVGLNLRQDVGAIPIVVISSDRSVRAEARDEPRVDVLPTAEVSRLMSVLEQHCQPRGPEER